MTRISLVVIVLALILAIAPSLRAENPADEGAFDVRYVCVVSVHGPAGGTDSEGGSPGHSRSFALLGRSEDVERQKRESELLTAEGTPVDLQRIAPWADRVTARVSFTFTRTPGKKLVTRRPYVVTGAKCLNLNLDASVAGLAEPVHLYGADCIGVDAHDRPSLERSASAYEATASMRYRGSRLTVSARCEKDRAYKFSFNF